MAEVLLEFDSPVTDENGRTYTARACGDQMPEGLWQGWIEFLPIGRDAEPVRSARETTQPNRSDTVYWATGLTPVFLEGSLRRALNPLTRPPARDVLPAIFDSPAPPSRVAATNGEAVLNPFSVYRKGEPLLRRQLSALSGWHLVNIITKHGLSDRDPALLAAAEPADLVELIVDSVRNRALGTTR
jgi:hypothetical protein